MSKEVKKLNPLDFASSTRRLPLVGILSLLLILSSAHGDIQITRFGERYDLIAQNAPLSEVLRRIDELEEASLRFYGNQDGMVNAAYRDVTLDELLFRLGISYMLIYEQDASGSYRLRDSVMGRGEGRAFSDEQWAHVMRLIRDLANDNVRWNAHNALDALIKMGCEIIPLLEDALYVNDYQGRHLAGQVLRRLDCPDYVPSDKLLEVTLQLLGRYQYNPSEYWSLFGPSSAFEYLYRIETDAYEKIREPLIRNLTSADPQERLLSAALLAERGESHLASSLVRILAPHLADNDIRTDGGVAAHALYKLGPSVLPHLTHYRRSSDRQQAELADLICTALETGEIPHFVPEMYAGRSINPLRRRTSPSATRWRLDRFPDSMGRHHNLREPRMTTQDHYGRAYNLEIADTPRSPAAGNTDRDDFVPYITSTPDPFPYTSRSGDTMETVARDFAVVRDDLRRLNPDLPTNTDEAIEPGTTILIPPLQ